MARYDGQDGNSSKPVNVSDSVARRIHLRRSIAQRLRSEHSMEISNGGTRCAGALGRHRFLGDTPAQGDVLSRSYVKREPSRSSAIGRGADSPFPPIFNGLSEGINVKWTRRSMATRGSHRENAPSSLATSRSRNFGSMNGRSAAYQNANPDANSE